MLWIKAFHIVSVIAWFSALFYLPRLFVYHAMCEDEISNERFKVMEKKLYLGIMVPGVLATLFFGSWLSISYIANGMESMVWLKIKLILVVLLFSYHCYCGILVYKFKDDSNNNSHVFYRWFNEFPAILSILVVILAVVKPF